MPDYDPYAPIDFAGRVTEISSSEEIVMFDGQFKVVGILVTIKLFQFGEVQVRLPVQDPQPDVGDHYMVTMVKVRDVTP